MKNKLRTLALAVLVVVVCGLGWWRFAPRGVPDGQTALVTFDSAAMTTLREDFNRADGEVRIIALLSPT